MITPVLPGRREPVGVEGGQEEHLRPVQQVPNPPGTRVRLPSKPAHEPSNGPKLPVSDVCAVVL